MRSVTVNILLAFVTHTFAQDASDKLVDQLVDKLVGKFTNRASKASSFHLTDHDKTTLGKPSTLVQSSPKTLNCLRVATDLNSNSMRASRALTSYCMPIANAHRGFRRPVTVMVDYPKPNVENTDNYRAGTELSNKLKADKNLDKPKKKVAIIGGGLSGLAAAKYLVDAGHEPTSTSATTS